MKSLHRENIAGNAKLRGKKCLMLSCKCCTVENFKEEYNQALANKEIQEFISKQEPLGEEFERVLHDNLWELYEK